MTTEEIIALEPRIGDLLKSAGEEARQGEQVDRLYVRHKVSISRLVGQSAQNEKLRESQHYETVIRALCGELEY